MRERERNSVRERRNSVRGRGEKCESKETVGNGGERDGARGR